MNWAEIMRSSAISIAVMLLALGVRAAIQEHVRYKAWYREHLQSPARRRGGDVNA
ncbi:MAG: hypothetical protein AB1700_05245 [Bacillota bacterium]